MLQIERSRSDRLHLEIKKVDSDLIKIEAEKAEAEQRLLEQDQQIEQLQKDLQAKLKREEDARIAVANAKKQAAVVVSNAPISDDCYASELSKYNWNVATMQRIMRAESGCNPANHNYGDNHRSCLGSFGLLQIGCVHGYTVAYLSIPANNIAAAYKVYTSQGYSAWTTY